MKRALTIDDNQIVTVDKKMKKKMVEEEEDEEDQQPHLTGISNLDQDLLFEILKHVDARSLGLASCVSKLWSTTAKDERLWEMICTRHWANNPGSGSQQQLRSVVSALGGFRRLHSHCLWPLLKPLPSPPTSSSGSSSIPSSSASATPFPTKAPTNWGKDEVHLSLSLLSIRFYEKMNPFYKGRS